MAEGFSAEHLNEFSKNPNYWEKGLPYLDGIDILTVPDPMTQMMMFKSGQAMLFMMSNQHSISIEKRRISVGDRPWSISLAEFRCQEL